MARQLIEAPATDFEPRRYKDEYQDRMMAMIQRKAKGHTIATSGTSKHSEAPVFNLMDCLQASVKATKRGGTKHAPPSRRHKSA